MLFKTYIVQIQIQVFFLGLRILDKVVGHEEYTG